MLQSNWKRCIPVSALIMALALTAMSAGTVLAQDNPRGSADAESEQTTTSTADLLAAAQNGQVVRVIITLKVPVKPEGGLASPSRVDEQRAAISAAQEAVLADVGSNAAINARFVTIPAMVLTVNERGLKRLLASQDVVQVAVDEVRRATLASSVPIVGADQAWAMGYEGSGRMVAVLDTGVLASHSFLSGRVTQEACFSTTDVIRGSVTLCPNAAEQQLGAGAASPAGCSGITSCDHGTHVAGIAAGSGVSFSGVAPAAEILAVQVFSKFSASACDGANPCVGSYDSDQMEALDYIATNRATLFPTLDAINLSLGGGRYFDTATCDAANASYKALIDNLKSLDVATVVASGNDGWVDSMNAPGCISTAITVGATTDADQVASFSNAASWLDLWAPGVSIESSILDGGFAAWNGTSMATPHVTGAFALIRSSDPDASIDEIMAALHASGVEVEDINVTTDRIAIDNAIISLHGDSYEIDNTSSQAKLLTAGVAQTHNIFPVNDVDWVKFTLTATSSNVVLQTSGASAADTRMWLYTGSLTEIEFDDDDGTGAYSFIDRICDVDALPAGTYYVKIDESGNNSLIADYQINLTATACNNPPYTPSSPSPSNGATNAAPTVALEWTGGDPDGDAVTYDVYFGTTVSPSTVICDDVSATDCDPAGTLANNTTYYWKVVASDGSKTAESSVWSFTTAPVNNAPNTPSSPSPAHNATNVAVTAALSWIGGDPDGNAVTYDVYFDTNTNPTTLICDNAALASCDPAGNLANSMTYYWKVVSSDGSLTATGPVWSFTTIAANNAPNTPSSPSPAHNATNVAVTAVLSWTGGDPDGNAVTYDVYFDTSTNPTTLICDNAALASCDPPGNLVNGLVYYWKVVASDGSLTTSGPVWSFTALDNNLITNGSFEVNIDPTPLAPDSWTPKGLQASTDGVDCDEANLGVCSFTVTGNGKAKKLVQKIIMTGTAGSHTLSFDTKGQGIAGSGSYMVKLKFFLSNGDKKSYKIKVTNTTTFGWTGKTLTFTVPFNYNRVDVTIQFSKQGIVWFDALRLIKN
jgi:subtilisin